MIKQVPIIKIRPATADDSALIIGLIRELAIYEKLESEVIADEWVPYRLTGKALVALANS